MPSYTAPRSKIKAAVDAVLEGHEIRGGTTDLTLREMDRTQLVETFLSKSDDPIYQQKIAELDARWLEDKDFVQDALRAKEDHFSRQFDNLRDRIGNTPELQKLTLDYSELPDEASAELFYNETIRQVRNFGDQELQVPNRLLREKIYGIDPNFSFRRFNQLPWTQQNVLLEQELVNLQETALDVHNMIGEVKSFWPDFNEKTKLAGKSLIAQYRSLSQTLENNQNYVRARESFSKFAASLPTDEFNVWWQEKSFRQAYHRSTDVPVLKRDGQYYRKPDYDTLIEQETAEARAAEEKRLADIKAAAISPEKQARLDELRRERAAEEAAAVAERAKTVNPEPVNKTLTEAQEKLRADIEAYNSRKYVSRETEVASKQFNPQEGLPEQFDPETGEKLVQIKPQKVVSGNPIFRNTKLFSGQTDQTLVSQTQSGETPPISETVNQVTKDTVQHKAVGETESARIEREAVARTYNLKRDLEKYRKQVSASSLLGEDTARSYTFGYKQKTLLGFMGTAGVVSLLEASTSGPNQEAIERRRRLEEERRRKQFGY